MGGGGQGSNSSSKTSDTRLSNAQADILQKREAQYQEYFFPELLSALEEANDGTLMTSLMSQQSKAINSSYTASKQSVASSMAQRGLSGSGAEAQALASVDNSRSSALSDAAYQAYQANVDQRNTLLQLGMGMSPTPTTAAPLAQESSSSSFGMNAHLW